MARVHRTDFAGAVRGVEKTSTGGLRVPAAVTRVGVLRYKDTAGREWGEYRSPEEVFDADSLATLRGCPVTDLHPKALVTPETWGEVAKGHVDGEPRRDGDLVVVDLAVQDANAVQLVEARERREVSCGYTCDVEHTPGVTPAGERYDAVQRGIRYNHVALGPQGWGRAGVDVALRMDGAATQVLAGAPAAEGKAMKRKLKIGGREFRLDADDPKEEEKLGDEAQGAIDENEKRKDADLAAASAQIDALTEKLTEALTQAAQLKAQLAAQDANAAQPAPVAEDDVPEAVVDSLVEKRLAFRADAARVLGDDYDFKGKKPLDVKRAAIERALPGTRLDGLAEPVLDGMFTAVVAASSRAGLDATRRLAEGADARMDGGGDDDPRAGMQRRSAERWMKPTTLSVGGER